MRNLFKLSSIVEPKIRHLSGAKRLPLFPRGATGKNCLLDEDLDDGGFYGASYPKIKPVLLIGL